MKTSTHDRRVLAHALRLLRAYRAQRPRRILLEEAEIELWGVYRREQADLLVRARALRTAPRGVSERSAWRASVRAWRAQVAECAEFCARDGYPVAPRLAACLARPARAWPSVEILGADARALGARCL